jgi:hypothetical protein
MTGRELMSVADRIRIALASTLLAATIWRVVNSLSTWVIGGYSPAAQAAMLCHRDLGAAFLLFVAAYYPTHIFLIRGFTPGAPKATLRPFQGFAAIFAGYLVLSRAWELSRALPVAIIVAATAWFELRTNERSRWRRRTEIGLAALLAVVLLLTTREGLVWVLILALAVHAISRSGSALCAALRRHPGGSLVGSGSLPVLATMLMFVFAVLMHGGGNAGQLRGLSLGENSPTDYFHRVTAGLWIGAVFLHVRAVLRNSTPRRPASSLFGWWIVALWLPVFGAVELGYWRHFEPFAPPAVPMATAPAAVSPDARLKGYVGRDAASWFLSDSKSCGAAGCHEEVVAQHERSAHGRSFENQAFKTALAAFIRDRGRVAADYCLACHAPLGVIAYPAAGAGEAAVDPLTTKDPAFVVGVDCVVCHRAVPDRSPDAIGNASLTIRPFALNSRRYLGEGADQTQWLHCRLIRAAVGLHRQNLRTSKDDWNAVCGACHVTTLPAGLSAAGRERLVAEEYRSFVGSRYARQGLRCAACHQQRFDSYDVGHNTIGHHSPGAGIALPYQDQWEALFRRITTGFLMGLGDITFKAEERAELPPCLADLPGTGAPMDLLPVVIERGPGDSFAGRNGGCAFRDLLKTDLIVLEKRANSLVVQVGTSNECVGHAFPTGDGVRAFLQLAALDADGKAIGLYGGLGPDGRPIETPSNLGAVPVDLAGRPIADGRFWKAAAVAHEKRLPAGAKTKERIELAIEPGSAPRVVQARWWFLRPESLRAEAAALSDETGPVLIGRAAVEVPR